ncbi:SDR family NAD(P)-dependent oxidoreductase, partial [Klebsiella pneumoniae]|nr:SDR family NAD(P)-dependent oxidoreductase [Klebsiella pneumoniae]
INNAGFGYYGTVAEQPVAEAEKMLALNVNALMVLSALYVQDYQHTEGAQLINISSAGGYTIVPSAVTYCATKFFVSAYTEGLARELIRSGAKLRAKVLAPAATQTEFGQVANNTDSYDYDRAFGRYHT